MAVDTDRHQANPKKRKRKRTEQEQEQEQERQDTEKKIEHALRQPKFFEEQALTSTLKSLELVVAHDGLPTAHDKLAAFGNEQSQINLVLAAYSTLRLGRDIRLAMAYPSGVILSPYRECRGWQKWVTDNLGANKIAFANAAVDLARLCKTYPKFYRLANLGWSVWLRHHPTVQRIIDELAISEPGVMDVFKKP